MTNKLNLKLILLECFALFFIISGIDRFYVAFNGKLFDTLTNEGWKKLESSIDVGLEQLIIEQFYWNLSSIGIGILITGILNWKYKFGIINSIIITIITLGMSLTGVYSSRIINSYLNYFCGMFSKKHGLAFLIGGIIILFIGIVILWKTIAINKNTTPNKNV